MDYITAQQGQPNYVASFLIADILLFISFVCALKIDMDLELPVNKDAMWGLRAILTNFEILLFLVMMFVCGSMYGFVETFLFVFLKEDLHAPMYLLGLTITTGAVVSLPFLYYSDAIVKKVGGACYRLISRSFIVKINLRKTGWKPSQRSLTSQFLHRLLSYTACFCLCMISNIRFCFPAWCLQFSCVDFVDVRGSLSRIFLHQLRVVCLSI